MSLRYLLATVIITLSLSAQTVPTPVAGATQNVSANFGGPSAAEGDTPITPGWSLPGLCAGNFAGGCQIFQLNDGKWPGCTGGHNVCLLWMTNYDSVTPSNTVVNANNSLSGYGAQSQTGCNGVGSGTDQWKSRFLGVYNGNAYMNVGCMNSGFTPQESAIICSPDLIHWSNRATYVTNGNTCSTSASTTGDAPSSLGQMQFPVNNTTNKLGWVFPLTMPCQDNTVGCPTIAGLNTATYAYFYGFQGSSFSLFLFRVPKTSIMLESTWETWTGSGWSSSLQSSTTAVDSNGNGCCSTYFYMPDFQIFTRWDHTYSTTQTWATAPTAFGPWTVQTPITVPTASGFPAILPASYTVVSGIAHMTLYGDLVSDNTHTATDFSLGPVPLGVTADQTQAVIPFHCTSAPCNVLVSESPILSSGTLASPVIDTNETLFPGSSLASSCSVAARCRVDPVDSTLIYFVVGTRRVDVGSDANNYSRALHANSPHYYQVIQNGTPGAVVPFNTGNIPGDETFPEAPQVDSTTGHTVIPTIPNTRNFKFIDPKTGTQSINVYVSADGGAIGLFSGNNKHMCPSVLLTPPGVPPGWLCTFESAGGADPPVLYYIHQSDHTVVYLGIESGVATWPTCDRAVGGSGDSIDPTFVYVATNYAVSGSCPNVVTVSVLEEAHYVGDYGLTPVTPGDFANMTFRLLTPNPTVSIPALAHAFDSNYDVSKFPSCDLASHYIFENNYGTMECRRGIQGTYAWYITMWLGDRQPIGSCTDCVRVVAAFQGWANPISRWTGTHSSRMMPLADTGTPQSYLSYITPGIFEGNTGGGVAPPFVGPYASLLTTGINNSITTLSLNAQPLSMTDATVEPYLQDLAVGDRLLACPATSLTAPITVTTSPVTVTVVNGSWTTNGMGMNVPPDITGGLEEEFHILSGGGTNVLVLTRVGGVPSLHPSGTTLGLFYGDCENYSQSEEMTITGVSMPAGPGGGAGTITVARDTPAFHGSFAFLAGANIITQPGPDRDIRDNWWSFVSDPHANTGGYVSENNHDFYGNHSDFGGLLSGPSSSQYMVTEAYHTRQGQIYSQINQATTLTIHPVPPFHSIPSIPGEGNTYSRYPVADRPLSTNQDWFLDMPGFQGGGLNPNPGWTLVAGKTQIVKYIFCTLIPNNCGGTEIILHRKNLATQAIAGGFTLTDVSGPGSVMVDGSPGANTYCTANAANECVTGSSVGDVYANVTGLNISNCEPNEGDNRPSEIDLCIIDGTVAGAVAMRYSKIPSATGFGAKLGSTLSTTGIRFPSELIKSTPDGNLLFYRSTGSVMYMMEPTPWVTALDSFDRSTFIPIDITIPYAGTTVPATTSTASVSFGYLENGNVNYCTTRQENCVSVSATIAAGADPFWFETTDTYTRMSCGSGCTIRVPALSSRTMYPSIKYYNAGGTLLRTDTLPPVIVAPSPFVPNGNPITSNGGTTINGKALFGGNTR